MNLLLFLMFLDFRRFVLEIGEYKQSFHGFCGNLHWRREIRRAAKLKKRSKIK